GPLEQCINLGETRHKSAGCPAVRLRFIHQQQGFIYREAIGCESRRAAAPPAHDLPYDQMEFIEIEPRGHLYLPPYGFMRLHDLEHEGVGVEVAPRRFVWALWPPLSVHGVEIHSFQRIQDPLMHHKVMCMHFDDQPQVPRFLPPGFRFIYIIVLFHVVPDDPEFLITDMEQYLRKELGGCDEGGDMSQIVILLVALGLAAEPSEHRFQLPPCQIVVEPVYRPPVDLFKA